MKAIKIIFNLGAALGMFTLAWSPTLDLIGQWGVTGILTLLGLMCICDAMKAAYTSR